MEEESRTECWQQRESEAITESVQDAVTCARNAASASTTRRMLLYPDEVAGAVFYGI